MKKIISLLILLMGLNLPAKGQTSGRNENLTKGHFCFGVSSNALAFSKTVSKYKKSKSSSTNISLDLNAGYFILNKLKLGLLAKINITSENNGTKTFYSFGPGMTYYFTGKSNLTPYLLASGGYYKTKSFYDETGYTLDLGAGAIYMINKTIGLNAHLLYDYKKGTQTSNLFYDDNDPAFIKEFKITQSNLSFRIGFSIFL